MPSEMGRDTILRRAEPGSGKGALGKSRASKGTHRLDAEPGPRCRTTLGVEPKGEPGLQGVQMDERLSLGRCGKVLWGEATAANRTREIRPSGMRGGLAETWARGELGTHLAIERASGGNSPPKAIRAAILPDWADFISGPRSWWRREWGSP